jgi:hypothetical protein
LNIEDFYEQWKKTICQKRSYHHQEEKNNSVDKRNSTLCNSELNLDMILHRLCLLIDNDESIITDKVNDSLTTETFGENEQLYTDKNSRISLFKFDKNNSMEKQSTNIFDDLFIVEKNSLRNLNLGKNMNDQHI